MSPDEPEFAEKHPNHHSLPPEINYEKKKKKNLPCYLDTVGISRTKQRIQINKINTQVLTDK